MEQKTISKSLINRGKLIQRTFLFFVVFCISVANTFAQDIIVKVNGEEIRAKIEEVGITEIKYRRFDNLTGPIFLILKSDVFMVLYENGTRDVFDDTASKLSSTNQQPIISHAEFTQLRRNEQAMERFFRENDAAIHKQFSKGMSIKRTGRSLLISGGVLTGVGIFVMVASANKVNDYNSDVNGLFVLGYVGATVGSGLMLASIPLFAVGGSMKGRAINNYEQKYFRNTSYQPTLNFFFTGNGAGLALNF